MPSSYLHPPTPTNIDTKVEAGREDNTHFRPPSRLDFYPPVSPSAPVLHQTKSSTELDDVFASTWGKYDPNTLDDDEAWEPEPVLWENSPASKDIETHVEEQDIETPVEEQQDITVFKTGLKLLPTIWEIEEPEEITDTTGFDEYDNDDWRSLHADMDTDTACEVASPRTETALSYHCNTLDVDLDASQSSPTVMSSNYLSSVQRRDDLSHNEIPGLSANKALYSTEGQNQRSSVPSSLSVAQTTSEVNGVDELEGTYGDDSWEGAEEDDTLRTQKTENKQLLKRSQWTPNLNEISEDSNIDFDAGLNVAWDQKTVETNGPLVVSSGRQHASTTGLVVITSKSLRLSTGFSVNEKFGMPDFTQQYESGAALFVQHDAEATNTLPSNTEDLDTSTVPLPTVEELEAFSEGKGTHLFNKFQKAVLSSRDWFGEPTSAPNSGIHHFNYFGCPQYERVDTNAAYSLRLILKGATHLLRELEQEQAFRQSVIMRGMYANIDPVIFFGSRAQLEELKSVEPEGFFRAVRGRIRHFYNPFGNWQEDQFDEQSHQPFEDSLSLADYRTAEEMGYTVLNGRYMGKESCGLLIPDFWQQTVKNTDLHLVKNADPHHPNAPENYLAKKNAILEHGHKRSRLCEVTTISADTEEEGVCARNSPITDDEDHLNENWTSENDGSSRTSDGSQQYYADDEIDVSEEQQPVNEEDMKDAEDKGIPALEEQNQEPGRLSALHSIPATDEPAMEKAQPYWKKLRLQVPSKAAEIAKPQKHSLRQSIKKAVWKLAPWALRPLHAS